MRWDVPAKATDFGYANPQGSLDTIRHEVSFSYNQFLTIALISQTTKSNGQKLRIATFYIHYRITRVN